MEGKVIQEEETKELIDRSNARFIYMCIDILANYDQNVLVNQELMPSRNGEEGLRVLWKTSNREGTVVGPDAIIIQQLNIYFLINSFYLSYRMFFKNCHD